MNAAQTSHPDSLRGPLSALPAHLQTDNPTWLPSQYWRTGVCTVTLMYYSLQMANIFTASGASLRSKPFFLPLYMSWDMEGLYMAEV